MNTSGLPIAVVEAGLAALQGDEFFAAALAGWEGTPEELLERIAVPLAVATSAWVELRQRAVACGERGHHQLEVVEDPASLVPIGLTCADCGETWDLAAQMLPDVALPTANGADNKKPSRRKAANGVAAKPRQTGAEARPAGAPEPPAAEPEEPAAEEPEAEPEPEPAQADVGPMTSIAKIAVDADAECEVCGEDADPETATIAEVVGAEFEGPKTLCTRHLYECEGDCDGCSREIEGIRQVKFSLVRFRMRLCSSCHRVMADKENVA